MHRPRSSVAYDILHGIQFPANLSAMIAHLSYFPPPPPVIPGPPSRRSWTCSSRSIPLSPCFVSNDRNPPILRQYIPFIASNQSLLSKNTSRMSINSPNTIKSSYLIDLIQNQYNLFIFLLIFILSIFFIFLFFLILFIYFQRHRQRQLPLNNHIETNNKNTKFYYRLIPHRQKHQINNNEQNSIRLRTHHQYSHSPISQVIRISTAKASETEEAV